VNQDVEQDHSRTVVHLRIRFLGLIGTVNRVRVIPNDSLDC
jgi:hypothetical protein